MTNQAFSTSDKSLSSNQEQEYDPKKQKWFACLQRWIPRLLGIVPLAVLTSSLMSQGGIQFGVEMYLISLASVFVLLFMYILVYVISAKCSLDSDVHIKPEVLNNLADNIINFFSLKKEIKPRILNNFQFYGRKILRRFTLVPWSRQESDVLQAKTISSNNNSGDYRQKLIQQLADISLSLKGVFLYLWFLRIQVFIALISIFLFQTGQVNDIVLAIILDRDWPAFLFAILFAFLLSLLLWHTSRYLTWVVPELKKGNHNLSGLFSPTAEMILLWLAWFSLALFTVPIAEQAYGPLKLFGLKQNDNNYLWHIYFLLLFQAGVIYLWRKFDFPNPTWTPNFRWRFIRLYGIGLILPFLFKNLKSYEIPELVGSLGVLFWALSTILIVISVIYQFSTLTGIPLLSILIVVAYFMNMNRINDNHTIRLKKHNYSLQIARQNKLKKLPDMEYKFKEWIDTPISVSGTTIDGIKEDPTILQLAQTYKSYCEKNRKFKDTDCRYPIYIASAQGGGIYAAYHTAKTFQTISDKIPNFRNHLFAISSVSGGSYGSAIYANWLRNCSLKDTREIDNFFDRPRDPLALIVASMFFGDLFQRFYPIPVAAWDRSLGLELAFEPRHNKIIKSDDSNPESTKNECINLNESFYETQGVEGPFYDDKQKIRIRGYSNPTPFMVLNTTEVDNGRRYLISPFRIDARYTDADFHEPWPAGVENVQFRDLAYSTAAGLSARFPLISPYGFFPEQRVRRFIDGGLYDNSGAVTANEIISSLQDIDRFAAKELEGKDGKSYDNPDYNLFRFEPFSILDKNTVDLNSNYANPEQLAKNNKFEIFGWTALTSVFSTRGSRTGNAVDNFVTRGYTKPDKLDRKVLIEKEFLLAGMPKPLFSIPLGWKLSCQARAFINDQLQVKEDFHVFIPCELKDKRIIKREPKRDRPRFDATSKYTKEISEMEQHLSFSVFMLIMEMKSRIGPIYKIPTTHSTSPVIISPSPPPRILGSNPPFTPNK
jgi:hypothetical protein